MPDEAAADALAELTEISPLPVFADIHFDFRLALRAIDRHVSAIRLNPGNLDSPEHIRLVAESAVRHGVPIRVGANTGSLRPAVFLCWRLRGLSHDEALAEALVISAMKECALLEKFGVTEIKVALKSSSGPVTVAAYRKFAARTDYPLHIGVTETGPVRQGLIKSAMGIGSLLLEGNGDTHRVSHTAAPVEEVYAAKDILTAAGLRKDGVDIISCPTCGRTRIDLIGLVNKVDEALRDCKKPITVAVMGCIVNGPGEAREADIGIAGGDGWGMIFEKGEQVAKLPYDELLPELLRRIENMDV